ncbi:uncharacterized protein H6S33_006549 [Morchella sextelata]|uniref:uncharacterized protein n=1 Tax=Morchella sextelata TaxID=1174677 RepID=UPI001D04E522|nr:uncharacterized protein H6S33_006549 [Morchella sextelata]KAH0604881.1 hypothetical protein H6S33_006549 [Morchella sextelata]
MTSIGPVVRITPNILSFSDHRAIKVIYGRGAGEFAKGDGFGNGFLPGGDPPVFFAKDPVVHSRVRKRIAHAYSMTSVAQMEPSVSALVEEFSRNIGRFAERGEEFDLVEWVNHLTFDLISELGYGKKFGFMETGGDVNGYQESMHHNSPMFPILAAFPTLAALLGVVIKYLPPPKSATGIGHLFGLAKKIIADRRASTSSSNKKDLLGGFLTSKTEDGSPISESSVFGEVMGTLIAGADTTAASIQGASLYLLQNPPVLQRLIGELDQTNPVSYADTLPLEYFNAVLKETLRLSPSIGATFGRKVPVGGAEILPGIWVPGGFEVGINNWVVGRDKALYGDDAMEFRPERWLEKGNRARFAEFEFGFGGGNRVCIGKNVAMMEICKTIPELFGKFELELMNPENPWVEESRLFLYKSGLRVRARRRVLKV